MNHHVRTAILALSLGISSPARGEPSQAPAAARRADGTRECGPCAEEKALLEELEKARREVASSRAEAERFRGEVASLHSEVESLRGEIGRLRGTGSASDLARELERLRNSVNDLRRDMAELTRALQRSR